MRSLQNCSMNGQMIKRSIWNFFDIIHKRFICYLYRLSRSKSIRRSIDRSELRWKQDRHWQNYHRLEKFQFDHWQSILRPEKSGSKNYANDKIDLNDRFLRVIFSSHFQRIINIHLSNHIIYIHTIQIHMVFKS